MQSFTIRDIENLTGIKAHTLRIWEQRFDFFKSKRKESQHRFFDNEDLKKLLRISFLYHNGWKISKIAALTDSEVIEEVRNTKIADNSHYLYVTKLLEAAVDFNELLVVQILNDTISRMGFEATIINVCYPFLNRVGLLWSTNNIIPAQEHFSSYIIQNRIVTETDKLPLVPGDKEILLVAPEGEFHELPLLFINYLLRKNSWSVIYLGTGISRKDVQQINLLQHIKYIYLHLITNFTGLEADDYFEHICKTFADKKIVASGEGIKHVQRNFTNLTLLRTNKEIYDFINQKTRP